MKVDRNSASRSIRGMAIETIDGSASRKNAIGVNAIYLAPGQGGRLDGRKRTAPLRTPAPTAIESIDGSASRKNAPGVH